MAVKESKRKFEEMGGNVRNFEESWALRRRRWCRESKKKKKRGRKLELDKPAGPKKQFYTRVHGENWKKLEIG